jgi:hypothetical protein
LEEAVWSTEGEEEEEEAEEEEEEDEGDGGSRADSSEFKGETVWRWA